MGCGPPGCEHASFESLTLTSYPLPSGPYFRLAYLARGADGGTSLVIWPSDRGPSTVLTTGDPWTGGRLEGFSVSRLTLAICAIARVRGSGGCHRAVVLASEDRVIWEPQLRDDTQLEGLGRVCRLLGPPGMYGDHGFVAAELDDGRTILTARSGGADPEVFAETGDPGRGAAGKRIARFRPPLANDGLPAGGPCGIASVVTLDSGATALRAEVLTSWRPATRTAPIRLVTGDHTDDQPAARIDAFAPVKLTNSGVLLLQSTMDISGRRVEGLLALDGLLDRPHTS